MVDLQDLELKYFCNGYDVPYNLRNGSTLNIKPILVKDYPYYEVAKSILEIAKNETGDIEIIKMSYLEFLFNLLKTNETYINWFLNICKLCFDYEKIGIVVKNNKNCLALCNEDETIEHIITSKEFDDISKIILNQNDSNYDNRYVSPEVKELMASYYKAKYNDTRIPTLEEKKAYVTSKTGVSINQLNDMTYRYFNLVYDANISSEIYIAQKMIQCSQKYEVKSDVKHPLFEPKKDPYAEIFEDTTILGQKGISGAENLNALNLPHDDSVKF